METVLVVMALAISVSFIVALVVGVVYLKKLLNEDIHKKQQELDKLKKQL